MGGASRGYSTAARALVGKSYAPSAPRAGQGTPQQETAEGLRLAVVDELQPRCSWSGARAQLGSAHTREGSTGSSCLACPVRSFIILPLLLSLRLESAACHACDCALSSLSSHRSLVSLSLSLSHPLSLSPCTCKHARCERTHTRTEWHARWNDILDTVMACSMHTVTRRRGRRRGRRRRGRQRARDARSRARARWVRAAPTVGAARARAQSPWRFKLGLHVSTGAEIETALCILESVLPTCW